MNLGGTLAGGEAWYFRIVSGVRGHEVAVIVPFAGAPPVRVTLEDWSTRLNKWLGTEREIEVGDPAFDAKFLVQPEARHEARARRLLGSRDLRRAIAGAFALGASELGLGARGLRVTLPLERFAGSRQDRLLGHLGRIARAYARSVLDVPALHGKRRAFVAGGAARCPYCHAGVDGTEPDLVSCRRCRTVLHDECWRELGHCPVLGCPGKRPQRASGAGGARGRRRPSREPTAGKRYLADLERRRLAAEAEAD